MTSAGDTPSERDDDLEDLADLPDINPRARKYRRSGSPEVAAALKLIRHKVKWGWSDRRIARRLVSLTNRPWTARQVRYWREVEGIKASGSWKSELTGPQELRTVNRRVYATRKGWVHLLGELGDTTTPDITERQVDILTVLAEHGPCTTRDIILWLKIPWKVCRNPLKARSGTHLGILQKRGWVVQQGRREIRRGVTRMVYALAHGLERHLPSERPTSIDLYERSLHKAEQEEWEEQHSG